MDLFDFTLRNVMLGAMLLGVTSGVLGVFAVLRQQSLLGDTLSHAALPGICIGFLLSGSRQLVPMLGGALFTGALAALFSLLLTRRSRLKTDASLGISLSLFFAIGTVLLTYVQRGNNAAQAGLESFLFGQAAAILPDDLILMALVGGLSLGIVALCWKEFKVATFDPGFAATLGLPVMVLETTLTVLMALAVVIGLQTVGVVLMAAMLISPAVAARQWSRGLGAMVFLAAAFGALSGVFGAVLSALNRNLSTGPVIVLSATALVVFSLLFAPQRGFLWAALQERRERRTLHAQQVLGDLYGLAQAHNDPAYASEEGMLSAYYGTSSRDALRRLQRQGLVETTKHIEGEGAHYRLTSSGQNEAERLREGR